VSARTESGVLFRCTSVVLVSGWLALAACWLLLRRQIERPPLWRWLRSKFRWRRHRAVLSAITPELGHCHLAPLPPHLLSDQDAMSTLLLLEDGKPMAGAHAGHDEIRYQGGGRYSHWGATLYFSASDNTDPASNGRVYTVEER
jgi:hypothetical protein